ncbi:MAG TPA: type II secretion system protein [Candidatus Aquilonibacter sp.]|jgi:prepilin-type N-terminal cleavage/methylation domain-containing protein|nr:type II secretion system protein [Candidatus Aquilonibacter sp.]
MLSRKQNGLSLLEMMITVSIILILCGVTFVTLQPTLNRNHVDSAYGTTLMALRNTRNLAITQSHEYYVYFNPTGFPAGTIQVEYQPPAVGAGVAPPLEQVITYTIPSDVSFAVQSGFPSNAPDSFGTGVNAIDFGQALAGEPLNYVVFMPDGSSQDDLGNFNSGVVYLTRPTDTFNNSRAITVWGATGRIRGWRMGQTAGVWTWVQQ